MSFNFWRRYLDGTPEYLARHYWWAYLHPLGVRFFDHHFIINPILFGQYRKLLNEVMRRYAATRGARTLQLTCAYGALTPALAKANNTHELHLMDVAEIQLRAAQRKVKDINKPVYYARINAEALSYADNSFDTLIIFFLLHELPSEARQRVLGEVMRVLKPAGTLLIAEYGVYRGTHFLHCFWPTRWLLEKLEPFLHNFWHSSLDTQLQALSQQQGKSLRAATPSLLFGGFYRVMEYRA